jgi:hypothetical protein
MGRVVHLLSSAVFLVWTACNSLPAQQNHPAGAGKPSAAAAGEEQPANATASLQKATQNPVANLISVPLQNNANFGCA